VTGTALLIGTMMNEGTLAGGRVDRNVRLHFASRRLRTDSTKNARVATAHTTRAIQ
jgi:hypothetical protein